jgi:hypothetical protein
MNYTKEEWFKEASYQLSFLFEFEEHFIVPDARTLNVFLKRPTLIIKMLYKDMPENVQEVLEQYENFNKDRNQTYQLMPEDIKKLEESYAQGLTPIEAVIDIVKWCDTPEQAGKFLVSPESYTLPMILLIGLMFILIMLAITLYGTVKDKVNIQKETETLTAIHKNNENTSTIQTLNAWDGNVSVQKIKNVLEITYTKVPAIESCFMMVIKQENVGWDSISVGSKTFDDTTKIKKGDLGLACDYNEKDNVNLVFRKNLTKQ